LVEGADDVLSALIGLGGGRESEAPKRRHGPRPPPETTPKELDEAETSVTRLLGPTPVPVDELLRQCHLSPSIIATVLLELELAGRLDRHPGGLVSLR
jgi:DNA processing protein